MKQLVSFLLLYGFIKISGQESPTSTSTWSDFFDPPSSVASGSDTASGTLAPTISDTASGTWTFSETQTYSGTSSPSGTSSQSTYIAQVADIATDYSTTQGYKGYSTSQPLLQAHEIQMILDMMIALAFYPKL